MSRPLKVFLLVVGTVLACGAFFSFVMWPMGKARQVAKLSAALEQDLVAFEQRTVDRPPAFGEPLDVDAYDCYRRATEMLAESDRKFHAGERERNADGFDRWALGRGKFPLGTKSWLARAEEALVEIDRGARGRLGGSAFDLRVGGALFDPWESDRPRDRFLEEASACASISVCVLIRDGRHERALDRWSAADTMCADLGRGAGAHKGMLANMIRGELLQRIGHVAELLPPKTREELARRLAAADAAEDDLRGAVESELLLGQADCRRIMQGEVEAPAGAGAVTLLAAWARLRQHLDLVRNRPGPIPSRFAREDLWSERTLPGPLRDSLGGLGASADLLRTRRRIVLTGLFLLDLREREGSLPGRLDEIECPWYDPARCAFERDRFAKTLHLVEVPGGDEPDIREPFFGFR